MLPESNKKFISRKTQRYYVPSNPPKKELELTAELAVMPKTHCDNNGIVWVNIRPGLYRQASKM